MTALLPGISYMPVTDGICRYTNWIAEARTEERNGRAIARRYFFDTRRCRLISYIHVAAASTATPNGVIQTRAEANGRLVISLFVATAFAVACER